MPNFLLTNKAVDDLSDIWNYTYQEWSENQADKYYFELISTFEYISESPNLGRSYDEINSNIFGYLVNMHIIFFKKINANEILIVRILHGSSDLKNRIKE